MKNQKIQILRALAIIAVVIIHSYPQTIIGIYIRTVVNYAVALFIFCSGYLTKLKYSNLLAFYKKRIIRIGIPYLLWTFIYMMTTYSSYNSFIIFLKNYIHIVLHGTATVPMYFVIVYIGFVCFTPLIGKLAKSRWKHIGWLISPIYIVLKSYVPKLTGLNVIPPQLYFMQFLEWFTFYYLGMLLANNVIQYRKTKHFTAGLYIFSLVISLVEGLIWNHLGDYNMATTQERLGCMFSSAIACLIAYQYLTDESASNRSKPEKYLIVLGDYSFGMYLSHVLIIRTLRRIPLYKSVVFPLNSLLVLLCTLIILVAIDRLFSGKTNKLLGIT